MEVGENIMKITAIIIPVLALVFSSCATDQKSAGASSGSGPGTPGGRTPMGQTPVETRASVLFADGSLDEYTTTDYDPTLSNMISQNRYSASGTLLEKVEFSYQDEKGWLTTKLTRDVEDRLKTRIVYQYNDQGLLWKEFLTNKAGKVVSSYEYGYDARGHRNSRIVNNATGTMLAKTVYTLNNAGQVISSATTDGSGRTINSTENQYDTSGNLLNQKVYNARGELTANVSAVWQGGHEVANQQTGPDGQIQLRVTNEYGPDGELLRRKVENLQGESTQIMEYEYTFKPDGK
jgi:hypothetical protein